MKYILYSYIITVCIWTSSIMSFYNYQQKSPVLIYATNSNTRSLLEQMLTTFHIAYQHTDQIDRNNKTHMYIIGDDMQKNSLPPMPPYYIWYQTVPLHSLKNINVLINACAVWEQNASNVSKYKNKVKHYCYMPNNKQYEYWDAAILSCFLPLSALGHYKSMLSYSNTRRTDIADHVPSLFCHCFLQNPRIIIEAGVRWGDGSTIPLHRVTSVLDAHMIGIDIVNCSSIYNSLPNTTFMQINSTTFPSYFKSMSLPQDGIDFVFIDTTHQYEQTMKEIKSFTSILSETGALGFHDSNPVGNDPRGVIEALKDYFQLNFDESQYLNTVIERDNNTWQIIHYPYCNGMTIVKRIIKKQEA